MISLWYGFQYAVVDEQIWKMSCYKPDKEMVSLQSGTFHDISNMKSMKTFSDTPRKDIVSRQ